MDVRYNILSPSLSPKEKLHQLRKPEYLQQSTYLLEFQYHPSHYKYAPSFFCFIILQSQAK